MSMSDAAPLPRLGEVFFDVRSPSRSLRISWYADTGVAVLSIWQGGTCTGSFRLPMGDLPRMIETLERGPDGRSIPAVDYPPQPAGAQPPHAPEAQYPREAGRPGAAAGYDAYQAGPGSLHYLNGSVPAQYPDETGARYVDGAAAARYPDETGAGYPHGATPARYPDETGAGHPDSPVPSGYRDAPALPPYSGEPGPADYPAGPAHRDFPAGPAGGPYPESPYPDSQHPDSQHPGHQYPADQHSGGQYPGDEYARDPYPADRHSGAQYADDPYAADQYSRDPYPAAAAGNGLESLPESFPYGQPHHSHRL